MSFEDIDTPVSESELSGDVTEPVTEQIIEQPEIEVVAEEVQAEAEEPQQERAPVIPRARFDEVNAKLHAEREEAARLREEIEALRGQRQAPQQSVDIDALEDQHFDALMEGDKEKAKQIRAQINAEIKAGARQEAVEIVSRQNSEREQQSALMNAVSAAVEKYPFLDSNADIANAQAINDVIEWRDFYMSKGDQPHIALAKASDKVGPMYAGEQEPVVVRQDGRKQAAIARNVQAANAQPPSPSAGVGNRAAPSVPKIETQSDWESLSASERDRLLMEG